jgi:phosphoribosylcarboxyaminoimidazole (NCAIR) mutase
MVAIGAHEHVAASHRLSPRRISEYETRVVDAKLAIDVAGAGRQSAKAFAGTIAERDSQGSEVCTAGDV